MTEQTMLAGIINEDWRSVSEYLNYRVSSLGRIRHIKTGRILKSHSDTNGYLVIWLSKEQIRKRYSVHRLVAREFIEKPDNTKNVDHIDHNKDNNNMNHLRWASRSQNNMNMSKRVRHCPSNFKGVYFDKGSQKWRARITTSTGLTHIGLFAAEIDAAIA